MKWKMTLFSFCTIGIPGFAAWVGIEVLGQPKSGSNDFVSAAAGGVGMFAGQLVELKGCKVVGSTGSDDKVQMPQNLINKGLLFVYF